MLESTWLFIGLMAVLTTAFAAMTQTRLALIMDRYGNQIAMIAGTLGAISWLMLAWGSLDIRVVGDAVTYSFTQPSVTAWCLMMAIFPAYCAWQGPFQALEEAARPDPKDV